jgi:hypothetical protein
VRQPAPKILISPLFLCELEVEEEGLRAAAPNNWYQSEKILDAFGDDSEMPLKPTMVAAANSTRGEDGRMR